MLRPLNKFMILGVLFLSSLLASAQTSTTISGSSPVPIVGFNAGDTVDIVATLQTTDVNENGEGEPLVLQSSTGFSVVVSAYAQPMAFSFKATTAGVLTGFVQGADGDESASVTATLNSTQKKRFTQAQKDAFARASAQLNTQAGRLAAIAAICGLGLIPSPPSPLAAICTGTASIGSGVTWYLSAKLNELQLDPSDPNFTVIAQPVFPAITLLTIPVGATQEEAGAINAFNAYVLNEVRAAAFAAAVQTAINRAQGAADAGNTFWETKQVNAANTFLGQLALLLNAQPALAAGLENALIAAGFPTAQITPSTVLSFEFSVAFNGLPAPILQTLDELGATQAEINQIRQLAIVQDINAASGTFPQLLTNATLLAALQNLANSLVIPVDILVKSLEDAPINPGSKGVTPVAILSTPTFDALTNVDMTSLTFGHTGSESSLVSCNADGEDVNSDGLLDLVCRFETQLADFVPGDITAFLQGATVSGTRIQGQAPIQTVPR